MKKTLLPVILFLFVLNAVTVDFQQPANQAKEIEMKVFSSKEHVRFVPEVEFVRDPIEIITNFYDYMPGGYNRNPMILQPEISQTYNYPADGFYIAFHTKESAATNSQRRIYFAYINANGELVQRSTISTDNVWEGFPGLDIDPITGDPFVAYHVEGDDNIYDCYMSYDLYHLLAAPGAWKTPFLVIDNPVTSEPLTGATDDEFIWPKVAVGPSPIEGKSRLFIYADNASENSNAVANYNILIGKTDFDSVDLEQQMDLEFEFTTIPELDDLHYNDIDRAIKDMAISDDGQVAFVGWHGHTFFVVYSDDYGDTYTYMEANGRWDLENPQNLDGTYYFTNEDGTPAEIFAYPSGDGGHFNAHFVNDNTKIVCMSAFGINKQENFDTGFYMPAMFYPKIYHYSIENGELNVHVIDLYITGADAYDGVPMVPWDLDEDGEVDEFTPDGNVAFVASVPSHYYDGEAQTAFFHESNFKISMLENWMIAVWQDAENVYFNHYEEPGYEDWADTPEIMLAVSNDYGETWSEPARLNAKIDDGNYYPQLNEMIPVYVYPADKLEVLDEHHALLHLFFMDDYSYGSFAGPPGTGANLGGMMYYTALKVGMFDTDTSPNALSVQSPVKLHNNYPNPFNPETTIKFDILHSDFVTLDIFNLKGQKVTTLVNETLPSGSYEFVWTGKDDFNQSVSSGVYFYKLLSGRYTTTKKMILMK